MTAQQLAYLRKAIHRWFTQRAPAAFSVAQVSSIIQLSPISDFQPTAEDIAHVCGDLANRSLLKIVMVEMESDIFYSAVLPEQK